MARGSKPGERRGGRKAGTPNRTTAATRDRIEREADPIGFLARIVNGEAIEDGSDAAARPTLNPRPTLNQRLHAAKILAGKVAPDARDRPVCLALPRIEGPADVLRAQATVLDAVASGALTPGEGAAIAGLLEAARKAQETVEIERRLAELERQIEGRS